ncbi:MAG: methyltransferase domain-containing protein [Pirellulaceae bacterium]|nr:methyltransferase domain-containing protein [Pirellulaceae bacterium]
MSPIARILEPESMESDQEAREYEEMDHSAVNRIFVDDLLAGGEVGRRVIDLGCGPAAIPIELCSRVMDVEVLAVDSSHSMLDIAKMQIDFAGLLDRIFLELADVKDLGDFEQSLTDTVISNSLLHHLPEPATALQSALHVLRPNGRIFIRDLARPDSQSRVEQLVDQYTQGETEFAKQLFRQSLQAALTIDEIRDTAGGIGISKQHVQMTSDRHWTIDWRQES